MDSLVHGGRWRWLIHLVIMCSTPTRRKAHAVYSSALPVSPSGSNKRTFRSASLGDQLNTLHRDQTLSHEQREASGAFQVTDQLTLAAYQPLSARSTASQRI